MKIRSFLILFLGFCLVSQEAEACRGFRCRGGLFPRIRARRSCGGCRSQRGPAGGTSGAGSQHNGETPVSPARPTDETPPSVGPTETPSTGDGDVVVAPSIPRAEEPDTQVQGVHREDNDFCLSDVQAKAELFKKNGKTADEKDQADKFLGALGKLTGKEEFDKADSKDKLYQLLDASAKEVRGSLEKSAAIPREVAKFVNSLKNYQRHKKDDPTRSEQDRVEAQMNALGNAVAALGEFGGSTSGGEQARLNARSVEPYAKKWLTCLSQKECFDKEKRIAKGQANGDETDRTTRKAKEFLTLLESIEGEFAGKAPQENLHKFLATFLEEKGEGEYVKWNGLDPRFIPAVADSFSQFRSNSDQFEKENGWYRDALGRQTMSPSTSQDREAELAEYVSKATEGFEKFADQWQTDQGEPDHTYSALRAKNWNACLMGVSSPGTAIAGDIPSIGTGGSIDGEPIIQNPLPPIFPDWTLLGPAAPGTPGTGGAAGSGDTTSGGSIFSPSIPPLIFPDWALPGPAAPGTPGTGGAAGSGDTTSGGSILSPSIPPIIFPDWTLLGPAAPGTGGTAGSGDATSGSSIFSPFIPPIIFPDWTLLGPAAPGTGGTAGSGDATSGTSIFSPFIPPIIFPDWTLLDPTTPEAGGTAVPLDSVAP